jgi:hypothetical protein
MVQDNSFISLAERITSLNANCVEILTKINDLVASQQSTVKIDYDDFGVIQSFSLPTVGSLKQQIDVLNQNMRLFASINGSTFIRDGLSVKKIITSDLNREPVPIQDVNLVSKFSPINNSFFESLMNPMLAISIDLTDKITQNVNKVLSRRYIVNFEKNNDGSLTANGLTSFNDFSTTWLNRSDIAINDFDNWLNNPTNVGIMTDVVSPYDEQMFELEVKELQYFGIFSVIKTEIDDINNKIWYHLNDLKYYAKDNTVKTLTIGDELIINSLNSTTRYSVVEVSTDFSNNKVRLELIEGYDPIVVGTNVLKYYSDISNNKTVQVTVGFNEYCVVFLKPINTDNNIIGSLWSKGVSFYTNNLILDTDNNMNLASYYLNTVYDYGEVLKDLVLKKIPTKYGSKPNAPYLQSANFKVVQINKHLTDSVDQNQIRQLHSQKVSLKTKISQTNNAIQDRVKNLNSGNLSMAEKTSINTELNKLKLDSDLQTKNLSSVVSQITTISASNNNVAAKYRIRGFWNIPEPIITNKSEPQHVVQFRIQYRYATKGGNSNPTEGYNFSPIQITTASSTASNTTGAVSGGGASA